MEKLSALAHELKFDDLLLKPYKSQFQLPSFSHPPPVIARDAIFMSLWQSQISSEQEKLQSLLWQLDPVDQDRLLRVMDEWIRPSRSPLLSTPKSTLLNVLTRVHPVHRSNVLRLLISLNQQEQERLIRVLDVLEQSEQVVELLEILNEHDVLEQRTILKVLYVLLVQFRAVSRYGSLKHVPKAATVLSLLKGLHSLDWSKAVRFLDGLDYAHQCTLLSALEGLDSQKQHRMLEMMIFLEHQEQRQLLTVLEGFPSPQKVEVQEMMVRLEHQEQRQLLGVLDGLDSPQQKKVLEMIVRLEHQEQRRQQLLRLLNGPNSHYQCSLLRALEGLDSQEHHKMLEVLITRLELHEQQQLLRVLEGLPSPHKVEFLEMMVRLEHQEQRQLLGVLDGLDYSQLIVHSCPLRCKMLEIVNGLELHEQQELLSELVSMEPLKRRGVLKVMYEFHTTGSLTSKGESFSFGSVFKAPILRLLNLLQNRQPIDRLNVEKYFDGLDPSEQKQLLRALDRLNYQERNRVEIFRLLVQLKEYRSLLQRLLLLFMCLLSICLSEDSQRGGFRNLLLDGWWLEFWEIILLAAGDVERNPGPTFMTEKELALISNALIEEDDLSGVFDEVRPVSSKWYQFCCCLGIPPSRLETIRSDHPGNSDGCLFEGLNQWLQRNYKTEKHGSPTWRKLVAAVDNSAGGNNHVLAQEVAKKHKAHEATPAQSVMKPVEDDCSREDLRRGHQHSAAFSKMYGAITRGIGRSLDVDELKLFLRYYLCPHAPSQHYVEPGIYEDAESTRDILDRLCPVYVNSGNVYLLEEIVSLSNSRQCKRLLDEYTRKYH